jgi:hypothetical protein
MMRVLTVAAIYFALVFACGFVLGVVRTLWVAPAIGVRYAELAEAPWMLVAIVLAARVLVARHPLLASWQAWLGVGMAALALLLLAEFTVVLGLRGLTLARYFASRDPVATAVYVLMLGLFAAMPALMFRPRRRRAKP